MREIDTIAIHCSATPPSQDIGATEIRAWHTDPRDNTDGSVTYRGKKYASREELPISARKKKGNGWSDIGYHYVIRRDGTLEDGRPNQRMGSHVRGHNRKSIGICYVGGVNEDGTPADTRTPAQDHTLRVLVPFLQDLYGVTKTRVKGHRDFPNVAKACPSFSVPQWRKTLTPV